MGASRKLQGEIDRVLKKVQEGVDVFESIWNKVYDTENANQKEKFEADLKKEIKKLQRYRDQIKTWIQSGEIKDKKALMDARKQIEREMERFKVCEKETKTKAFSKEGLVQQPKTDPKEKAKSETREWLNNVVGDLESQIDNFEAEVEALSVRKGKSRPPRLAHLETSITRHKAHIMKLELILRLLDNDELSPEHVNDVKDFIEDYVERNQDDFEEFSDVDELYSTLPLDKVESLEDLVAIGSSAVVKGVASVSTASAVLGMKNAIASSPSQLAAPTGSTTQQTGSSQDQAEGTGSQENNSDVVPKTPLSKPGIMGSLVSTASPSVVSGTGTGPNSPSVASSTSRGVLGGSNVATTLPVPGSVRGVLDNSSVTAASGLHPPSTKEDDSISLLSRRPSPSPNEISTGRGVVKGSLAGIVSNAASVSASMSLGSFGLPATGALGAAPAISDLTKRNILVADERIGTSGLAQPQGSPLTSKMLLQQTSKSNDGLGSVDVSNASEGAVIGGRVFSPLTVGGVQWRPQSVNPFQNQNETGQFRGRAEIAPDQREKFLERLQKVKQGASQQQFPLQHNSLLQQLSSQSSLLSPQVGLGLGVQPPGLSSMTSASQQQSNQQLPQQNKLPSGSKDADVNPDLAQLKVDEQQPLISSGDLNVETPAGSESDKSIFNEDDLKSPHPVASSAAMLESSQLARNTDLSPGQPLQSNQSSASLGVIGRRSVSDLGTIGDSISNSVANSGGMYDRNYNLQMLEAAYYKLPQPKDSERVKNYTPRCPAVTPPSYPQVQAPIIDNPAFWERFGLDNMGTDTLFFAFYYQQNTYQQYLAARELKRQSWRYHRKYNTWFQRHEEPKITTDDYEQGTYVYFDFHLADDGLQHGWCQRIKTEFTFEYSYLEDELPV